MTEVNFKDYLNLKDYLTSIILKIISPQANSYKCPKVLRPQRLVGHKSWNIKFWNFLSRFCSCFWRASFSYQPIQPNKIFYLPRVLELFGSQQRIRIDKVSYFGFNGCLTTVETFFVEVFPSVPMAIPFLITLDC